MFTLTYPALFYDLISNKKSYCRFKRILRIKLILYNKIY